MHPLNQFLEAVEQKSQDYRSRGSVVIVAFGDSVTMGATALGVLEPGAVYHNRLKQMLEKRYPKAVFSVINSGIGGDTAAGGLARLERDVLRFPADLVLVAFGLNDASEDAAGLERYRASLEQIIKQVRAAGADVLVLTPSFVAGAENGNVDPGYRALLPKLIRFKSEGVYARFAQAARDVARENHVALADVYAAWEALEKQGVDTTAMLANGLNHPTGEAHRIAADAVMQAILEAERNGRS